MNKPNNDNLSSARGIKFRAPKNPDVEILADSIGFKAPKETRERLTWLRKCLNYSANRIVIEAVDAVYNMIQVGHTHTPDIVLRGRDLKKYVQ
ncbi:MAG: hypothetical protein EBR82_24880 [Caulobacteraceae bacterium]|jgi:hypothetical protein|nr:hypothetical protein [Caulobacteraceae bacterium]